MAKHITKVVLTGGPAAAVIGIIPIIAQNKHLILCQRNWF